MQTTLLGVFAGLVLLAAGLLAAPPAYAGDTPQITPAPAQDFSAVRKHRWKPHAYRRGLAARRTVPPWMVPGDPTPGPNSMYWYWKRQGRCVVDEGYGRATPCDWM